LTLLALVLAMIPLTVTADYTPPANVGAPESFTVQYREDGFEKTWIGFDANISASDELRAFVDVIGADDSAFDEAGFGGYELMAQIDYKLDDGRWHYKSEWDDDRGYNTNKSLCRIEKGTYSSSVVFDEGQFESISDGETLEVNRSYFDAHTMHFRVRFVVNYQDENGEYFGFFSPWSETASYSNNQKVEDPDKLINHAPVLKSAELKKSSDESPYLKIRADKAHEDTQLLNNISNGWVKADVWLRVNNGEWKSCHSDSFVEEFNIGAEAYFGLKDSYDAAVYEIKFRYSFDNDNYPAAGKSGVIYSPFSNIISHGMAAYSNASNWAKTELDKAAEYDLIPQSLKGADMTKPITREEFAELAVKLYEKTTGTVAVAASPNPFTDTKNPEILKAFKVGVTTGTSATTFAPKELTNREQVATMLSRAIRVIAPGGDFSTAGAPTFTDQKDISSWALEHVMFMSKSGIIKGTDGKFMPKAVTTAQTAAGYATTTREQAIAMSVRSFEQFKDAKPVPSTNNAPIQSEQPKTTAVSGMPSPNGGGLSGVWMGYYVPYGSYSPQERYLIFYEDGTLYHDMPWEGLDGFDRVKSKKDEQQEGYWGTYTFSGSTGTWKYNSRTNGEDKLELNEKGHLKIDNSLNSMYYPMSSVDGLRLEGAWTTYADPEDSDLGKGGILPIIRFTKDGRFKDEGVLSSTFSFLSSNEEECSPGEGSYSIKDFTMTLKYDDGRVHKAAFSLNLTNKPEAGPDPIFMYRTRMWKTNY
jgi:hypothetical protein